MSHSALERLRGGETYLIKAEDLAVEVSADTVRVHGCDCSAPMPEASVRELHGVLGAYLRHHKNKENKRMDSYQSAVADFHRAFGVRHLANGGPNVLRELLYTRMILIAEEFDEVDEALDRLSAASRSVDWPAEEWENLAKELADLLYVVFGTADVLGIPMVEVFDVVHRSNMSKLGADGLPVRRVDGKVLKGPNYRPADLSEIIDHLRSSRLPGM